MRSGIRRGLGEPRSRSCDYVGALTGFPGPNPDRLIAVTSETIRMTFKKHRSSVALSLAIFVLSVVSTAHGQAVFNPGSAFPTGGGGAADSAGMGDFNGDGITDLAVGSRNGQYLIHLGLASGGYSVGVPFTHSRHPIKHLEVRDFDGDGVDDLLLAESGASGAGDFTALRNEFDPNIPGSRLRFTPFAPSFTVGPASNDRITGFALGDVVGGPEEDIVLGVYRESALGTDLIRVFEGLGGGLFRTTPSVSIVDDVDIGVRTIRISNMDGVGRNEIICTSGNNEIDIWFGPFDGSAIPINQPISTPIADGHDFEIAELDARPGLDLAIATTARAVSVIFQEPPLAGLLQFTSPLALTHVSSVTTGRQDLAVADVDGDGNPDLISGNRRGSVLYGVSVSMHTASRSFTSFMRSGAAHTTSYGSGYLVLGDVTPGGTPDIISLGDRYNFFQLDNLTPQVSAPWPGTETRAGRPERVQLETGVDALPDRTPIKTLSSTTGHLLTIRVTALDPMVANQLFAMTIGARSPGGLARTELLPGIWFTPGHFDFLVSPYQRNYLGAPPSLSYLAPMTLVLDVPPAAALSGQSILIQPAVFIGTTSIVTGDAHELRF